MACLPGLMIEDALADGRTGRGGSGQKILIHLIPVSGIKRSGYVWSSRRLIVEGY
jgi:hypothetical protein